MRLQIFGIDRKCLFKFLHRVRIAFLEKKYAAKFVAHDAVARKLLEHGLQVSDGAVVVAVFLQRARVKEIRARKLRIDRQRFLQHFSCPGGIALLHQDAADIGPAIGIPRIGVGNFLECRGRSFQIALQEEADSIVIPTRPLFFRADSLRLGRGGILRKDAQRLGVFGNDDDGKIGNSLEVAGNVRSIPVE